MKVRNIIVSIATASVLFTACGGGGDGGTPEEVTDYGDLKINTKTSYSVLSGETAYVTLLTGSEFINTTTGQSYYTYSVKDKGSATQAKFSNPSYGILRYKNSGSVDNVVVTVKDSRNNKTQDSTITFTPVAESSIEKVKILQTGQAEGDWGVARDFSEDSDLNNHDNVNDLTWSDLTADVKVGTNVSFDFAKRECADFGRLPTVEELYTTVEYKSENFKKGMLDPSFSQRGLLNVWADNGKVLNYTLGYAFPSEGNAEYRCVKGEKKKVEHVVFTDLSTGDVFDLTTGLQWSKVDTTRRKFSDADDYCKALINRRNVDTWELPTINQLRTLAPDGVVSGAVIGSNANLLSSTKAEDNGTVYYYGISPTSLKRTDFLVSTFKDDQEVSVTCVREYSDSDLDAVK